jgi:hypothetical protein
MTAAVEEKLAQAVERGATKPPAFEFQLTTINSHFQQWMSAMNGGHARHEERRVFKHIFARWGVALDHLPEAHRELEQREHDVETAMAMASTSFAREGQLPREVGGVDKEPQGGGGGQEEGNSLVVAAHEAVLALLDAFLELDATTVRHLAEEEELVVPLLLEWCKRTADIEKWREMNDLRGLCECPQWYCWHRQRELGLPKRRLQGKQKE